MFVPFHTDHEVINAHWTRLALLAAAMIIAVLVVYGKLLTLPFFQDDFFVLRMTQNINISELWRFFHINPQVVYYRPISMPLFFYTLQYLFGLDPFAFRVVVFFTHMLNGILVWMIFFSFSRRLLLSWLGAFLYLTATLHFISLAWISEYSVLLGTTLILVTMLTFLKSERMSFLPILLFQLGLFVHEIVIVIPAILFVATLLWRFRGMKDLILRFSPFALVGGVYLWLRFFLFPPPLTGTYTQSVSPEILKTLFWYVSWAFQIPEEFRPQTLHLFPFELNALFASEFFGFVFFALFCLLLFIAFFLVIPTVVFFLKGTKGQRREGAKTLIFGAAWFLLAIGPFLTIPAHAYPLYANVASIGLLLLVTCLISLHVVNIQRFFRWKGLGVWVTAVCWVVVSILSTRLAIYTHWTVQVATRSERILTPFARLRPTLPEGSIILLPKDTQLQNALLGGAAFQVLYGPSVSTIYGEWEVPKECDLVHGTVSTRCLLQHKIYGMTKEGFIL